MLLCLLLVLAWLINEVPAEGKSAFFSPLIIYLFNLKLMLSARVDGSHWSQQLLAHICPPDNLWTSLRVDLLVRTSFISYVHGLYKQKWASDHFILYITFFYLYSPRKGNFSQIIDSLNISAWPLPQNSHEDIHNYTSIKTLFEN